MTCSTERRDDHAASDDDAPPIEVWIRFIRAIGAGAIALATLLGAVLAWRG